MELQSRKKKLKNKIYWPIVTPQSARSNSKSIRHVIAGGPSIVSQSTLKNDSQFNLDSFKRRQSIAPFTNSNFHHSPPTLQNRKSSKFTPQIKETAEDSQTQCDSPCYGHLLILSQLQQRMRARSFVSQQEQLEILLEKVASHQFRRLLEYDQINTVDLEFLKEYFRSKKKTLQILIPLFVETKQCPIQLNTLSPLIPIDQINDYQFLREVIMAEDHSVTLQGHINPVLLKISRDHFEKISSKSFQAEQNFRIFDLKEESFHQNKKTSISQSTQSFQFSDSSSENEELNEQQSYSHCFASGLRALRTKEERWNRLFVYSTIQQHFPQILNQKRIAQIFAFWFNATNSQSPECRCNISLHTPKLRSQFFACLAMVEHSLSLQQMLKSPRRLSTDRLVRKGRRSLQPCLLQRAALQKTIGKVIEQKAVSSKAYRLPSLPVNSRQSGQDLAKLVIKDKKLKNMRSIERSETSSDQVFMLTIHSIQKTVSVNRGDFQKNRFQRFKAHHFISPKLSHFIQAIVPIRLLKEHSLNPSISDSMLDPSLLSAMSASFRESPQSSFSSNKPLSARPTAPKIQISHSDTSKLDSSGNQSLIKAQRQQKKRRGSRTPNPSSFSRKILQSHESESSSSFSSFTSTSSQFSEPEANLAQPNDSPRSLIKSNSNDNQAFIRERSVSPEKPSQYSQIIDL